MVGLLREAGVKKGDTIAIGASGSFPGAVLATLAAARAMDLHLAIIVSLGSSSWGANVPGFSLIRIMSAQESVTAYEVLAVSLGGDGDSGGEMDPLARDDMLREVYDSGQRLIDEPSLADGIAERMMLYDYALSDAPISAFVNIGGASANIGVGMASLSLTPGVNTGISPPSANDEGVMFEMAARGIPVIHVLNIKRLALNRGLAWDPAPFPRAGASRAYFVRDEGRYRLSLMWLAAGYAAALAILAFIAWGKNPIVRLKDEPQEPPQP
jgi:poly-gamma-glutamate system protein